MQVISPRSKLVFYSDGDLWKASILIGDVILVEADGAVDDVFAKLAERIGALAERLASAIRQDP